MKEENTVETAHELSVPRLLLIGLLTRLFTDTAIQIFFPFLPVIARGMNTTTVVMGRLISLRSAMGLFTPLFGVMADRRGYRLMMRVGLLVGGLGLLLIGASTRLWMIAIGLMMSGLGIFGFVPTLQAYLSARLPVKRRARGLAILEYSWALSGILGLSGIGLLIEYTSWRVPFFILGAALLTSAVLYSFFPHSGQIAAPTGPRRWPTWHMWRTFFAFGANRRSAISNLAVNSMLMFSAMHLFLSYGRWLENEYGLTASQLGTVALGLGFLDLGGSVVVSWIVDGFGRRRSVIMGLLLMLAGYILLPLLNGVLLPALVALSVVRFAFEFTLVSNISLLSEQVPAQRGKVMSLGAAAALIGSTLAGWTGPWGYEQAGIWGLAGLPLVALTIASLLLFFRVNDGGERFA